MAIEKRTMVAGTFSPTFWLSARAPGIANVGSATCHLRSPVLSECHPTHQIAGRDIKYGIAVASVTSKVVSPDSFWRILGSQISTVPSYVEQIQLDTRVWFWDSVVVLRKSQ